MNARTTRSSTRAAGGSATLYTGLTTNIPMTPKRNARAAARRTAPPPTSTSSTITNAAIKKGKGKGKGGRKPKAKAKTKAKAPRGHGNNARNDETTAPSNANDAAETAENTNAAPSTDTNAACINCASLTRKIERRDQYIEELEAKATKLEKKIEDMRAHRTRMVGVVQKSTEKLIAANTEIARLGGRRWR